MTSAAACPACAAAPLAQSVAEGATPGANLYLSLPTIHCAACIGKVERALTALPGVRDARVNLSLKRVAITADTDVPDRFVAAIAASGYEAYPLDSGVLGQTQDNTGRQLLSRLAVAGFAMMNVMLLSVAVWSGATDATRDLFHLISAMIAVPVVGYAAQPFFVSAWTALRVGRLNMDVPISLAILLAVAMSLFETLSSGAHAYFDAALSLTFFLLIGRYLDHRTRAAARSAAKELSALEVQTATRIDAEGQSTKVAVSDLRLGDSVLIPTGMRVPVDGTLTDDAATTDRSFLTGESAAVTLTAGSLVQAGEVNLGAPFRVMATAVGEDTTLRRVAGLVEMAENSRNSYTALADRAAQIYAPAVHLLAFAAFLVWMALEGDLRHALNIAIAVLIITCPCALGLAVPAVATTAMGTLYRMGLLVKSGTALERLAEVDTIVFDKTGTLTLPGFDVTTAALSPTQMAVIRTLAQASDHPVSRAIATALRDAETVEMTQITELAGIGMQGTWQGKTVRLEKSPQGLTLRIAGDQPVPLPLQERLRPGAVEAVRALQDAGYDLRLMSGDRPEAVTKVADQLGIAKATAAISAEDKHAALTALATDGHKVLMVGDGLNDTAALAAAHASIAPSSALDASRNAADIVLLRENLGDLPGLMKIARKSVDLSRGNFRIATAYNVVAVPIACLGFATPLLAALAMSTSSITVLLNALRVRNAA